MPKIALHLSREELETYNPGRHVNELAVVERWEKAWKVAHCAARLLREKFKAKRVVAFGSVTHQAWFASWSDVDLAVWGVPADQFYQAVAAVSGISPEFGIDLVDPEECRPKMRHVIEQEGVDL